MAKRRGRGEGGIESRKTRAGGVKYRCVLCRGKTAEGKRLREHTRWCDTKTEAMAERDQMTARGPSAADTVGEWLTEWLSLHKPDVAPKTYRHDSQKVERWLRPRLGPLRLRNLDGLKVRQMLRDMAQEGYSDSERQKAGAVLRKCLNVAVGLGKLPANPMSLGAGKGKVKLPTPKRPEKKSLTAEQLRHLIRTAEGMTAHPTLAAAVRLWADAGLRPGEAFALTWDDFDPAAGTVAVRRSLDADTHRLKEPKTKKSRRTLPLAPSTVAALAAARPAEHLGGILLPDTRGGMWWESNFAEHVWGVMLKAAGLAGKGFTPYCLRHTCATLLIRAGVPIKVVSERLGHDDVTTTLRTYAHVMEGDQQRAATVMEGLLTDGGDLPQISPKSGGDAT